MKSENLNGFVNAGYIDDAQIERRGSVDETSLTEIRRSLHVASERRSGPSTACAFVRSDHHHHNGKNCIRSHKTAPVTMVNAAMDSNENESGTADGIASGPAAAAKDANHGQSATLKYSDAQERPHVVTTQPLIVKQKSSPPPLLRNREHKKSLPGAVEESRIPIPSTNHRRLSKYDNIPLEPLGPPEEDTISSFYFEDGMRRIDFVLVYEVSNAPQLRDKTFNEYRKVFESNLVEEGLLLEYTSHEKENSTMGFVKVHAPWDVLSRYAELMKLKMPMKNIETSWQIIFDEDDPYCKKRFTAPYTKDKEYLFNIPPAKEEFFNTAQRSQIVDFILKRKGFSSKLNDAAAFGINKLLQDGVYLAAFPLHEGKLMDNEESPRMHLLNRWAAVMKVFKKQPLDEIRRYYGVKIALYFAWLGFYTSMLIPASIVGFLCFLYGVFTLSADSPVQQICSGDFDHTPMCPLCTMKSCTFFNVSTSCTYSKITYLFDNPATVFFAVFMSLWATVYLEMWKRYSARITYRWDLSSFDAFEEYPRPEYLARLSRAEKKKLNIITRMYEPYVPFWKKQLPYTILSGGVVLLLILVAFACVLGVIVYRVSVRAALAASRDRDVVKYSSLITASTAAMLNLICIMILNSFYTKLAVHLTELEMQRTQTDFDNSLTLKMYLLQFINYYSSIFYIAFFKGRFVSYPGDLSDNESSFAKRTQEECGTGGCLVELAIQLAIIMVGKQALNAAMEMSWPWFEWCINRWTLSKSSEAESLTSPQWESDFLLAQWKPQALFYEYLEMVLQFGFVTIFVAAFPLAPLFALINNAFEIRLDAKKMITAFRRPVAQRVKNIGIWYRILDSIGKLSVISNALIIAFTSDFIPRLYHYSKYGSLQTYLNDTFSFYEASKFKKFNITLPNSKLCMYQGHRHPPESGSDTYLPTQIFWEELTVKLAFILVFENVIASCTMLLRWLIPDIPRSLRQQMRQHAYLTNELIMQQETKRAKEPVVT